MKEAAAPEGPRVSTAAAFLWMVVYTTLTTAGIILISHLMGPLRSGLAMFGVWLLQLILIIGLAAWANGRTGGRGLLPILIIAYAVYALVYGIMLGHVPQLFYLRETPLIPLREAAQPDHSQAQVFHFSDGRVDLNHVIRRTIRGRGRSVTYLVAPLLPPDWKRDEPVTAWVGVSGIDERIPASWKEDLRGGYRVGLDSRYDQIVEDTVRNGRLRSSPGAPILVWSQDPKGECRKDGFWELAIFLVIDIVGVGAVLFSRGGKAGT